MAASDPPHLKNALVKTKKNKTSDFPDDILLLIIEYIGRPYAMYKVLWPDRYVYQPEDKSFRGRPEHKMLHNVCIKCGLRSKYWNEQYKDWIFRNHCLIDDNCEYCCSVPKVSKKNTVICRGCKKSFKYYDPHFKIHRLAFSYYDRHYNATIIGCNIGNKNIKEFEELVKSSYFIYEEPEEYIEAYYGDTCYYDYNY